MPSIFRYPRELWDIILLQVFSLKISSLLFFFLTSRRGCRISLETIEKWFLDPLTHSSVILFLKILLSRFSKTCHSRLLNLVQWNSFQWSWEEQILVTILPNCLGSGVLRLPLDMRPKYFYSWFKIWVIIESFMLEGHLVQALTQRRVNTEFRPVLCPISGQESGLRLSRKRPISES